MRRLKISAHFIFLQRNCWLNLFENFTEFYRQQKENSVEFSDSFLEQFLCKKNKMAAEIFKVLVIRWLEGDEVMISLEELFPPLENTSQAEKSMKISQIIFPDSHN